MEKNDHSKAQVVLWAATGLSFVSGILYIWSIVSKALIKQYHWTSTEASLPYTVATIVFAFSMVFAGRLQDKKGPRLSGTIGGALLGIGLFLSAFAKTPLAMVLTFSLIVGMGIGINNVAATPPAVKWFPPDKKGMITGIVVAGIGFASVVYSPLINYLMNHFGISKSFFILGIGAFVLAVVLAQFLSNPPGDYHPGNAVSPGARPGIREIQSSEMNWKEMLKTGDFYKLWIMLAFSAAAGLMIIGHIANIARTQANWEGGYLLVALLAVFNTLGRLLGGTLSDKIGRINLLRLAFLLQAINMALFGLFTTTGTLAIGVVPAGLCYGAAFSVFPAATADFYGLKNLGANYGLLFTAWGIGGVIGPLSAGRIFDITGSYNTAYVVSLVLLLVAVVFTFTFRKSDKTVKNPII